MANIVDSYVESNYVTNTSSQCGQSFTGNGGVLQSCKFYLQKSGSPVGNVRAKIYAHSGTFGSSSIPTGSALATSGDIDASTISTTLGLVTFTFTGANKITLTNGTKYIVVFETSFTSPNYILAGYDSTSPSHGGNYCYFNGSVWNYDVSRDLIFYVYSDASSPSASPSPSEGTSPSSSVSPSSSISPSASPSLSPSSSFSSSFSSSISESPSPSSPPGAFFGLKIAKSKYNVLQTDEPERLKFSSDYGTLKYFQKISKTIQIDPTDGSFAGTVTHDHDLGYYPFVEVFVRVYTGATPSGNYEYVPFSGSGATVTYNANYKITTSQIVLYAEFIGVSANIWNFEFLIFVYKNNLNL